MLKSKLLMLLANKHRHHIEPWQTGARFRWKDGFWGKRFDQLHQITLPSMRESISHEGNAVYLGNFKRASGLEEGRFIGTNWSDGDAYKYTEALSYAYALTKDPDVESELDAIIDSITKAQDPDGYLSTQTQLTGKARWSKKHLHELYNMGHLMTAAVAHNRVTGKRSYLDVAVRAADYLCGLFLPDSGERIHLGFNPSQIMGLVDLFRATGESRYKDLARRFIDNRGADPDLLQGAMVCQHGPSADKGDQNQDRVPLREESEAVGHAVTAMYLYAGAADYLAEEADEELKAALLRIWDDVVTRKMYITGGVGASHRNISLRGDAVHEAFAMRYKLPNASAYNETCANIANAMWNWRLLKLTGEVRFADVMEQVLYNSGLSGINTCGDKFTYTNPLRWNGSDHVLIGNDTPHRWRTHKCYCCPPQVARTIGWMYQWMSTIRASTLYLHLFGSYEQDIVIPGIGDLSYRMLSDYPWSGEVRVEIIRAPSAEFPIAVRIPGWACGASLSINGDETGPATAGHYARFNRRWQRGDVMALQLPMKPRIVVAHRLVEEARNQACVVVGPVVYCMESIDLPDGVEMDEIYLPRTAAFDSIEKPHELGGITRLRFSAARRILRESSKPLYQDIRQGREESVDVSLIPYYAWNNRGDTRMTVWLPLA